MMSASDRENLIAVEVAGQEGGAQGMYDEVDTIGGAHEDREETDVDHTIFESGSVNTRTVKGTLIGLWWSVTLFQFCVISDTYSAECDILDILTDLLSQGHKPYIVILVYNLVWGSHIQTQRSRRQELTCAQGM